MRIPNKVILSHLRDFLFMSFGIILYITGYVCFQLPYHITGGGIAGVASVIYFATSFQPSYTYLIINVFLLILALKILGLKFLTNTIYAVIFMTLAMGTGQQLFAVDLDNVYKDKATGQKIKLPDAYETPEKILEISQGAGLTPSIIAESFSSTPELRKYHVLFAADKPVTDISQARQVILNLQDVFGSADEACKDPARILFGSSKTRLASTKLPHICGKL